MVDTADCPCQLNMFGLVHSVGVSETGKVFVVWIVCEVKGPCEKDLYQCTGIILFVGK